MSARRSFGTLAPILLPLTAPGLVFLRDAVNKLATGINESLFGNVVLPNDLVTVTDGTETKELKYKKAEPLIASGAWKLVS